MLLSRYRHSEIRKVESQAALSAFSISCLYPFDFGRVFLVISLQPSVKLFDAFLLGPLRLVRGAFLFDRRDGVYKIYLRCSLKILTVKNLR